MSVGYKPKIAILTIRNSYNYGGVLTCVKQVYKFCEKYFDPTVFYLSFDKNISANLKSLKFSSQTRKTKYSGMNAVEIGSKWAFWEPGHYSYTLSFWEKVLEEYDYFFVESGSCICAYPLVELNKKFAMWVAAAYQDDREKRIENLSSFRLLIEKIAYSKMLKLEKLILDKADFIWALSKDTKLRIDQVLGRVREDLLICNFPVQKKIDLKIFDQNKEKNIIVVGRFSDPRKNPEMLFRVFDKIYSQMNDAKLFVVGMKPDEKVLEKFKKLKSYKNIIFTGVINSKDFEFYYKKSSLMILTSYQEGLGIVGLDALSYGIPVVATDCGGTRDYIVNGQNGFLVKINDDEDMVKKSIQILSSPDLHKKMSEFAIRFIEQHFSEEKIYSIFKLGLCKVYPELKKIFEEYDNSDNLKDKKVFERLSSF